MKPRSSARLTPMIRPLLFSTAGDAVDGLLFGWDIAALQSGALIHLNLSDLSLALVWLGSGQLRQR